MSHKPRTEEPGGAQRKRRLVPPVYGANTFHAKPTEPVLEVDASPNLGPPPKKGMSPAQGHTPLSAATSQLQSAPFVPHVAPFEPSTLAAPPSRVHLPNGSGQAVGSNGWAAPEPQMTNSPQSAPVPPVSVQAPPPGSRRDGGTTTGSSRTKRLAAPPPSFANGSHSNGFSSTPSFSPVTASIGTQPDPFLPTLSHNEHTPHGASVPPPQPSNSAPIRSVGSQAPVQSPSLFSPAGRGSGLFEPSTTSFSSSHSPFSAKTMAPSADFWQEENEEPLFGPNDSKPVPSDDPTPPSPSITQAKVVNTVFEVSPTSSPPETRVHSPPPQTTPLQASSTQFGEASHQLSTPSVNMIKPDEVETSLFEDDGTSEDWFGARPELPSKSVAASSSLQVIATPAPFSISPPPPSTFESEFFMPPSTTTSPPPIRKESPPPAAEQGVQSESHSPPIFAPIASPFPVSFAHPPAFSPSPSFVTSTLPPAHDDDLFGGSADDDLDFAALLPPSPAPSAVQSADAALPQQDTSEEPTSKQATPSQPTTAAIQQTEPQNEGISSPAPLFVPLVNPTLPPAPSESLFSHVDEDSALDLGDPTNTSDNDFFSPINSSMELQSKPAPLPHAASTIAPTASPLPAPQPTLASFDLFASNPGEEPLEFGTASHVSSPHASSPLPDLAPASHFDLDFISQSDSRPHVVAESTQIESPAPAVVSSTFTPSPAPVQASLFGEADDEYLDFSQPSVVQPPQTTQPPRASPKPQPVAFVPSFAVSHSAPSPFSPVISSIGSVMPLDTPVTPSPASEPHAAEKTASTPAPDFTVQPVHQPVVLQPVAAPVEESIASHEPPVPMTSSRGRAGGAKRPRHFQYNANQAPTAPPPTSTLLSAAAPPPKGHAHVTAVANAPVLTPSFMPVPGGAPPTIMAPVVEQEAPAERHENDSPHSSDLASQQKGSFFDPIGELQSKGLSWLKKTFSTGSSSSTNSTDASDSSSSTPEPHFSTSTPPLPQMFENAPALDGTPTALPPSSMPTILPPAAKKKRGAKPTARIPFHSSVAAPAPSLNGPQQVPKPVDHHETEAASPAPPPKRTETPSNLAPLETTLPAALLDEQQHFQTTSALVAIDYSQSPHSSRDNLAPAKSEDPFGSEHDAPTATDLFSRLRSFSGGPSSDSGSTEEHSITPPSLPSISFPALSNQEEGILSPLAPSSPAVASDFDQQLKNAQEQIKSLQARLHDMSEDLARTNNQRDRLSSEAVTSSHLISALQSTERELRSTVQQLQHRLDSTPARPVSEHGDQALRLQISDLELRNGQLREAAAQSDAKVASLEHVNISLQASVTADAKAKSELRDQIAKLEYKLTESVSRVGDQAGLQARVQQLEKQLQEERQSAVKTQALALANANDANLWKSKYEAEVAAHSKAQKHHEEVIATMEAEERLRIAEHARAVVAQEALAAEAKNARSSQVLVTEMERRHADELVRLQQENERYISLMQQQAASQTSVIERLINQNADLLKGMEFARRVIQESKNPDSIGGLIADNDRLQEELESNEKELVVLRQKGKDLEAKSTHFERECEELLRRLHSIDYRLLFSAPGATNTPPASATTVTIDEPVVREPTPVAQTPADAVVPEKATNVSKSPSSVSIQPSELPKSPEAMPKETPLAPQAAAQAIIHSAPTSGTHVPTTPGDWQPKSPLWSPTLSSPVQSPSRLPPSSSDSTPSSAEPSTLAAKPAFVVTMPLDHQSQLPGIQHGQLTPIINLDEYDDTIDLGEDSKGSFPGPNGKSSPQSSSARALKVPPQRGIFGRIWQAVTLQ